MIASGPFAALRQLCLSGRSLILKVPSGLPSFSSTSQSIAPQRTTSERIEMTLSFITTDPSAQPSSIGPTVDIPMAALGNQQNQEAELRSRQAFAAPQSPTFTLSSSASTDSLHPLLTSQSSDYHTEFPTRPPGMAQTALEAADSSEPSVQTRERGKRCSAPRYSRCVELSILTANLAALTAAILVMCGFTLYPKPPVLEVSTFAFSQFSIEGIGGSGNAYVNGTSDADLKQLATGMGWDKLFSKVAQQPPPYRVVWSLRCNMTLRSSSAIPYTADSFNWQLRFPGPSHLIAAGSTPSFVVPRQSFPSGLELPIVSNRSFDSLTQLLSDQSVRSLLMACGVMDVVSTDIQNPRNPTFVVMSLTGSPRVSALRAISWTGLVSEFLPTKPQRISFSCPADQVQRLINS